MCLTLCLIYGKTIHSGDLPSPPWPPKPLELSQHFVTDPRTACLNYDTKVLHISDSVLLHICLSLTAKGRIFENYELNSILIILSPANNGHTQFEDVLQTT